MQVLRRLPNPEILNLSVSVGHGGEACIYAVPSDDNLVAKIYHKPTISYAQKLRAMLANPPVNPTDNLGHIAIAWPQELLQAADGSGTIVGFVMPRIRGMRPIMDFYNPGVRRLNCPKFNYQYLLRTARNLAAAFAALHASRYCIGDVNESNILVSDTALVTLVDTDSFQVPEPLQNIIYRCSVGKPEYTPPELQNKTFADYDRESSHDLFGLAVLIFQLLMEGTHPFSGIFQGGIEPPTYQGRILSGHFTYSQKKQVPYLPTPISPRWDLLHPSLQDLFVRCFEEGHDNPKLRPNAQNWLSALTAVEQSLETCTANPQHLYHNHLDKCPWCERTRRLGGRDPFPSVLAIASKQHLQPLQKPKAKAKRRYTHTPRITQPFRSNSPVYHWQPIFNQQVFPVPSRQKLNPKVYGVIFGVLGLSILGCLDVMIKFTSPFVSQNPYTQQSLMPRSANQASNVTNISFADYYQRGDSAYQQQDYQQAVINFTQALKINPQSAKGYVNLGNALYNLNNYEGALANYNKALNLNSQEVKAYINRGNAYYMMADYSNDPQKQYKQAIADFNTAINIDENDAEAYIRRGIVRFEINKYISNSFQEYQKSIADFTKAIKLNASKVDAYFQRGLVRYQVAQYSNNYMAEYKQAIADFTEALKINPRLAKIYLKRGMAYYELAQYGAGTSDKNHFQAISDLETAAKVSLEENDMDNYQQSLSSICVVVANKCDSLLFNTMLTKQSN
jgi:DNA-binding helix-hairpin-helix protein with protein kinase domain